MLSSAVLFLTLLVLVAILVGLAVATTVVLVRREARFKGRLQAGDDALSFLPLELRPSWFLLPDVEQAKFISLLASSLWPHLKEAHEGQLRRTLDESLEKARQSAGSLGTTLIDSIRVSDFSLGSLAPSVVGVKAYSPNAEEYVLDAQLRFDGHKGCAKLNVEAVTRGFVHLPIRVGIEKLVIQGTVRLELRPLIGKPPYARSLHVSFLQLPLVDFDLRAVNFNVMALPGLTSLVSHVLKKEIYASMLFPKSIAIPLVKEEGEEVEADQSQERGSESVASEAAESRGRGLASQREEQRSRRGSSAGSVGMPPLSARHDYDGGALAAASGSAGLIVRALPKAEVNARALQATNRGAPGGDIAGDGPAAATALAARGKELHVKVQGLHGIILRPSVQAVLVGARDEDEGAADATATRPHAQPHMIRLSRRHKPHTSVEAFIVQSEALRALEELLRSAEGAASAGVETQAVPLKRLRRPPGGSTLPDSYNHTPTPAFPIASRQAPVSEGGSLPAMVRRKVEEGLITAERVLERAVTVVEGLTGHGTDQADADNDIAERLRLHVIRDWCSRQKRTTQQTAGGRLASWTALYYPAATHPLPGRDPAINETLVLPLLQTPSSEAEHGQTQTLVLELLQYDPLYSSSRHCVGLATVPLTEELLLGKAQLSAGASAELADEPSADSRRGVILQPAVPPQTSPRGGDALDADEEPSAAETRSRNKALKKREQQVLLSAHKGSGVMAVRAPYQGTFMTLPILGGTGNIAIEVAVRDEAVPPTAPSARMAATSDEESRVEEPNGHSQRAKEPHRHHGLPLGPLVRHPEQMAFLNAVMAAPDGSDGHDGERGPRLPAAKHTLAPSEASASSLASAMMRSESSGSISNSAADAVDKQRTGGRGSTSAGVFTSSTGPSPSPMFSLPEASPAQGRQQAVQPTGGRSSADTVESGSRFYLLSPDQPQRPVARRQLESQAGDSNASLGALQAAALEREFSAIASDGPLLPNSLEEGGEEDASPLLPPDYQPLLQHEDQEISAMERLEAEERHERIPLLTGARLGEQQVATAVGDVVGMSEAGVLGSPWDPWMTGVAQESDARPRFESSSSSSSAVSFSAAPPALSSFTSSGLPSAASASAATSEIFRWIALSSASRGLVMVGDKARGESAGFALAPAIALAQELTRKGQLQMPTAQQDDGHEDHPGHLHVRPPPPQIHIQPTQTGSASPVAEPGGDNMQGGSRFKPPAVEPWLKRAEVVSKKRGQQVIASQVRPPQPPRPEQQAHPAAGTGLHISVGHTPVNGQAQQRQQQTPIQQGLPIPNQTPLPSLQQEDDNHRTGQARNHPFAGYTQQPLSAEQVASLEQQAKAVDDRWDGRENVLDMMVSRALDSQRGAGQPSQPASSHSSSAQIPLPDAPSSSQSASAGSYTRSKEPSPLTKKVLALVRHDVSYPHLVQTPLPMGSPAISAHRGGHSASSSSSSSGSQTDSSTLSNMVLGDGTQVHRIHSVTRFRSVNSYDQVDEAMAKAEVANQRNHSPLPQETIKAWEAATASTSAYLTSPGTRARAFSNSERRHQRLRLTPRGGEFDVAEELQDQVESMMPMPAQNTPTATLSAQVRASRPEKISFSRMRKRIAAADAEKPGAQEAAKSPSK